MNIMNASSLAAVERRSSATLSRLGLEKSYPFRRNFLETPMGFMHYADEGSGTPILALHGNPTWSYLYRDFIRDLSSSNRVIAPDHIGFGLSDKPDETSRYTIDAHARNVETLIRALDLRDITLIMQDWGGPIGLGAAARNPDRIRAVVILNTFGFYPPVDGIDPDNLKLPAPLVVIRSRWPGRMLVSKFGFFERMAMPSAIARKDRWKRARTAYTGVFQNAKDRAGVLAFPHLIPTNRQHPTAQILINETGPYIDRYEGPAQIYWGLRDPFYPVEALAAWKKRLPQAEVTELKDAKHYLQEDAPETIIPGIKSFLARLPE